jgi:hypothetical protein
MSIDHTPRVASPPAGLAEDVAEIRALLARLPFPAQQDDVLAALVRRQAPSRLLWRAGCLTRTRRYHSLDEVCAEISRPPTAAGSPPPPGW